MPSPWRMSRPSEPRAFLSTAGLRSHLPVWILAVCLLSPGLTRATDTLEATIREQKEMALHAAQSQRRVDETFETTRKLLQEYKRSLRELESLRRYNEHLGKMTRTQETSIRSLETRLDQPHPSRSDIVPLMTRMVETLERFIGLDMPFLLEERRRRVEDLRQLIDSPDLSLGEKYRRVLEAYRIETDSGRTVAAYRGTEPMGGKERTVDFLRVGRIALLYRSLDGKDAGFWDTAAGSWKSLPDSYRGGLAKGLRVAQKQSAPELLRVPVPAPEALP